MLSHGPPVGSKANPLYACIHCIACSRYLKTQKATFTESLHSRLLFKTLLHEAVLSTEHCTSAQPRYLSSINSHYSKRLSDCQCTVNQCTLSRLVSINVLSINVPLLWMQTTGRCCAYELPEKNVCHEHHACIPCQHHACIPCQHNMCLMKQRNCFRNLSYMIILRQYDYLQLLHIQIGSHQVLLWFL